MNKKLMLWIIFMSVAFCLNGLFGISWNILTAFNIGISVGQVVEFISNSRRII